MANRWMEHLDSCIVCGMYSDEMEDGTCTVCIENEADETIAEVEFDGEDEGVDVELQEVWM